MGLGVEQELSGAYQFGKKREENKISWLLNFGFPLLSSPPHLATSL
jgi:hypothetical protein